MFINSKLTHVLVRKSIGTFNGFVLYLLVIIFTVYLITLSIISNSTVVRTVK